MFSGTIPSREVPTWNGLYAALNLILPYPTLPLPYLELILPCPTLPYPNPSQVTWKQEGHRALLTTTAGSWEVPKVPTW